MIFHYFKIAYRNHTKHKIQSIISLFSIAIAFAMVSVAIYWIHYEQTYDSFLSGYNQIYKIANKNPGATHPDDTSVFPLLAHLKDNYPEVDKAWGVYQGWGNSMLVEVNNHVLSSGCLAITPETVEALDIQWLEGNQNVDTWEENEVGVSEQIAREVCSNESPIGHKVTLKNRYGEETGDTYQIAAIFKTRPKHSNFRFNILKKLYPTLNSPNCETYVRLHPKADSKLFLQKLATDTIINLDGGKRTYNVLTPLKEVHYTYFDNKPNIRLNDVKLFTGAAILLSICALLNYLTLFVCRLRNRGRDMALRTICGSSSWQMGLLLMVEYLLLLLGALLVSMLFIELVYSNFVELSQLEINRSILYTGCGYLLLFILGLATLLSLIPILYFKHKTLRVQIESVPVQLGRNRFRIAGICIQLFISMLFIFCATVMIKQVHYLTHDDIHIERKNIASIMVSDMRGDQIMNFLRQIPMITEMVLTQCPLFPCDAGGTVLLQDVGDKVDIRIEARRLNIDSDVAHFYGLRMKEGDGNFDIKHRECLINETLAKQLGYSNPIGKTLFNGFWVIRGIVYDFQYQSPAELVPPAIFTINYTSKNSNGILSDPNQVAFKYLGDFTACKAAIEKAFEGERFNLEDGETVYKGYLASELNLLKLLNIVTIISLLIALFGVYALILQECERYRKSIAVRKVFGAQVKDILMMFFKEYITQVVIAAVLAFPIGYVLMKRWLEGYSRQTAIGIEVFLGIFIGMTILVSLCIGWHVWRAANENPATAVKKE